MLRNCDVEVYVPGKGKIGGEYLFTIDSVHSDPNMVNTSVAEVPSEHKQFNVGKLVNGQFFAQPNNRMLWYEQSLTPSTLKTPDFKVAQSITSVSRIASGCSVIAMITSMRRRRK